MRAHWFLILLFNSFLSNAQTTVSSSEIKIQSLPAEGVLLDSGWRFALRDSLHFADTNYNGHEQWTTISPAEDVYEFLPKIKNSIAWFRLRFSVDTPVKKQLAFMLKQSGASEIYLNGKVIRKYGVLSSDISKIKAYDPQEEVIPLDINKNSANVISVRYALQPAIFYLSGENQPALQIRLLTLEDAIRLNQRYKTSYSATRFFLIGAYLLCFALHFAFYLYHRALKANLYFALFAVLALASEIHDLLEPKAVTYLFYVKLSSFILSMYALLMLYVAFHTVLKIKRGWRFCTIVLAGALTGPLAGLGSGNLFFVIIGCIFFLLLFLQAVGLFIKAIKSRNSQVWILSAGVFSFIACFILYSFIDEHLYFADIITYKHLVENTAVLSIPIAMSIFLGLEFGKTNKALDQKLNEVEALSAKALAQEREKQQILASQNELLEQQVTQRTAALNESLEELKLSQSQLIQKEKMASLGELTAGIAHEIQNPLNFVNNFSEVSGELMDEMENALQKDNKVEALTIASDIKDNLRKISGHGKRADAIVKGMLEHSRTSKGEKEPTDINSLADEYLRLSYHGLRAKDTSFNANFKTDFDESIGKIEVAPQDIGRVLLNLYNNAFYSVNEKKKLLDGTFEPTVEVSTKKVGDKVELSVKDNGTGIPQKVLDKIYQPFFTTKPAGKGTGLGLSLSYDIITKAHGGEIKVETKEGEYARFRVLLPSTSYS